jgi:hypothetical protein
VHAAGPFLNHAPWGTGKAPLNAIGYDLTIAAGRSPRGLRNGAAAKAWTQVQAFVVYWGFPPLALPGITGSAADLLGHCRSSFMHCARRLIDQLKATVLGTASLYFSLA